MISTKRSVRTLAESQSFSEKRVSGFAVNSLPMNSNGPKFCSYKITQDIVAEQ